MSKTYCSAVIAGLSGDAGSCKEFDKFSEERSLCLAFQKVYQPGDRNRLNYDFYGYLEGIQSFKYWNCADLGREEYNFGRNSVCWTLLFSSAGGSCESLNALEDIETSLLRVKPLELAGICEGWQTAFAIPPTPGNAEEIRDQMKRDSEKLKEDQRKSDEEWSRE